MMPRPKRIAAAIAPIALAALFALAATHTAAQDGEQDRLADLDQIVWSVAMAERYAVGRARAVEYRAWDHPRSVVAVAISPDGRFAITGSWESAKVWNLQTGAQLHEWTHRFPAYVTKVAFSPDGSMALTGAGDGSARLWAVEEGAMLQQWSHWKDVEDIAFSADGSMAVTVAADRTAKVWSVATGELLREMAHPDTVRSVAFTPDGTQIVTGGMDKVARLWDVQSGQLLRQWQQDGPTVAIAVSADGRLALTGNGDGTARLLDLVGGAELHRLRHEKFVYFTAFSRDGTLALTASADGTARLWDVATGNAVRSFQHDSIVTRARFSPDERLILTASTDRTVRLWDARTGVELERWAHDNSVHAATFSADGRMVLTGSNDRKALLFDVAKHFADTATIGWLRHRASRLLDFNLHRANLSDASQLPAWRRNQIIEYAFYSAFGAPVLRATDYDPASQRMTVEIGSDSVVAPQLRYRLAVQGTLATAEAEALTDALRATAPALVFAWDGTTLRLTGGTAMVEDTPVTLTPQADTEQLPAARFAILPTRSDSQSTILPASGR